ncbi:transketolase family protein [Herbivorax sp. ANBcel31]|uniref:transketolase family protein n=1 Tax=Herbivorax sp. ANBcel31 TaxID=3069754 RepID=UPI0027B19F42|nr:transketolase family protein [Herbivorax sp. ANBcel31]MDQ2085420.1 transketolase family protein [Herbivorax sp. ANBcel31]
MKVATRAAYGKALAEIGADENIVVLDADLSKSTKTESFKKEYPERFINMGIAESNMMSVAAGIASCGKTVFASTFAMFASGRAFEQVRNSIAYPKLNVKIGATHAGISVGEDGASHQCIEDIATMRVIPNMTVLCPADGVEARQAIIAAHKTEGPFYIRLARLATPILFDENNYKFELGKGVTMKEGSDVTIMATGMMVSEAVEAVEVLKNEGINARLVNIHTIKPIDKDIIIKAAKETGAIVTCEEHNIMGGFGSAVAEVLVKNCPVPLRMVGVQDKFGKSGKPADLMKMFGLTAQDIVANVKDVIKTK